MLAAAVIGIGFLVLLYFGIKCRAVVKHLKDSLTVLQNENNQLSEKTELLSLAEQISRLGTWQISIGDGIIGWSDELYAIYGFQKKDFRPDLAINEQMVAPEYRVKVKKEIDNAIKNKSPFAIEYQIIQPSGIRKYVLSQGFYVEKEHKIVGTLQDITELKEAVLKLKINESLFREAEIVSHSGSWEWIEGKEFVLCSDEMYNLHGYLPHSVFINLSFYKKLIHKDDVQKVMDEISVAYQNKAKFKINYRIVWPSGEIRHVLSTAEYKKISLNENYAYIGNTQDVTQLREAQVLLEEKMVELKRSNQDLEQFAYIASHDLQEPLRKIQSFGNRLNDKFSEVLTEEGLDYLGRMRNAASRMRILIDDLLNFSKAARDQKNYLRLNMASVIEKSIRILDHSIETSKAEIELDANLEIEGIETQLVQLFQNLISNSMKFTKPGQRPHIEITAQTRSGAEIKMEGIDQEQHYAVIEVRDKGIGFDEENAEKIFDIFYRLHARTAYDGTGIGLAICRRIAENHFGFIYANSDPGKGASFTLVLPQKQIK
ncbi:sensor histidine kinase [Pedobacter metabolipauper]|uniref:histidine kinase n=1 Tax=Pedobacter metabolipauper TaxID=425513 RepID=A0A4R6SYQ0_9SPHI|nr:PAS domain-containing protein [Pedobacter metabolipauper]TDQ09635.1 PAS domain S-box-containing protein [Pedobacter metabolipauper]